MLYKFVNTIARISLEKYIYSLFYNNLHFENVTSVGVKECRQYPLNQ